MITRPEVIEIWKKATGTIIRDGYGQTETVLLAGNFPCIEPRFGSMGKPSPGFDLQVVDGDGNPLGPNMEGDIAVRVKPERPVGPQTIIPVPSPLKQYMEKCTRYPYSVWIEMLKRKNTASVMVLPS